MKTSDVPSVPSGPTGPNRPPIDLNSLAARLLARDAEGRLLSLLTGNESEAELRALACQVVEACPVNCSQNHCPFHMLGNLYHVSSKALITSMSRSALVSLFEAEVQSPQCPLRSR
ncbi:MAG TPA: hypothetical protein VL970_11335 [Candidatus Acidoferrales bacterium]|nr:hypothetical protein [Candidatus Acidoferrales bacterium]